MKGSILVTGGASGIGRAVVDAVIVEGWRAAVLDLPGANLDALRAAFDPATLHTAAVDVTDEAAVTDAVAALADAPLAGVVTCAGAVFCLVLEFQNVLLSLTRRSTTSPLSSTRSTLSPVAAVFVDQRATE